MGITMRSVIYRLVLPIFGMFLVMSCSLFGGSDSGPVSLGSAGDFVILAKTEISTVPDSAITGDIGLSPADKSYLHGFSQTDATGYATSDQVTGKIYAADMADPTPINLTTAVVDMQDAYDDAAGMVSPDYLDLEGGNLDGLTLSPGLYTWGSPVMLGSSVTLHGLFTDKWIFQISGTLTVGSGAEVVLSGGAKPENIVWQVADTVSLGANSVFKGTILGKTQITMLDGATLTGRALSQSKVSLIKAIVTEP